MLESFDEALKDVDVVMMLRIQSERLAGLELPDSDSYHRRWGLTPSVLRWPPQVHRDASRADESRRGIASQVADGPQSVIREQVANGVAARMAVLTHLMARPELFTMLPVLGMDAQGSRGARACRLQQFDRNAIRRPHKCHVTVPWWPVDGGSMLRKALALA